MPAAEVYQIQTGEESIEIGSPKDGRIKLFLSQDEVENPALAQKKIDNLGAILEYAKKRLVIPEKSSRAKKGE